MKLHRNKILRQLLLPLFRKINLGDIKVKHAHTGNKILLHSYNHKGYWYKGRERAWLCMLN